MEFYFLGHSVGVTMICDIISEKREVYRSWRHQEPTRRHALGQAKRPLSPFLSGTGDPCDQGRPVMADVPLKEQGEKCSVKTGNQSARGTCFAA